MPAGQHAAKLQREPPREGTGEWGAGCEQPAGAVGFEREQCPPAVVAARFRDVRFGHSEAGEILLRQVNPVLAPIHRDVLPEVDKLQRGADCVRMGEIGGRCRAIEVQEQPADRVGRAPTVVEQIGMSGVARRRDVLPECRKEIPEWVHRQRVPLNRGGEVGKRRIGLRTTGRDAIEGALEAVQRGEPFGRLRVTLVGQVVGGAREPVNRQDCRPQVPRQQERGDGKVFVMDGRHAQRQTKRRKDIFPCRMRSRRGPVLWRAAPAFGYTIPFGESGCESGGIGRRTGFRFQRGSPWGFESPLSHQQGNLARI